MQMTFQTRLKPAAGRECWAVSSLLAATMLTWAGAACAQTTTDAYFPTGNTGYDQQLGVTVLSRLRPAYDAPGIHLGGFTIRPNLDQTIFDNSNVNGSSDSGASSRSWGSQTAASVSGQSDWSRNSLAATVGVDHFQFFGLPSETYTDYNIGLSAGYTIGDSPLTASYSHQSFHSLGTAIGTAKSDTPQLNETDSGELSYTFNTGRFAITPTLDVSAYRFGDITSGGITQSQTSLDRKVIAGGVVTRYALTDESHLLFVFRGVDTIFDLSSADGESSPNSTSELFLTGLDFQAESVWRYSLLVGVENRSFASDLYATETAPIAAATVVWTPTGVLTLTGTASRTVEDPTSPGNDGFVLNQARLVVDYELLRDVLLQARGGIQYVQYLQSGKQTSYSAGAGVTWLINRNLRLSLNEDYTTQSSADSVSADQAALIEDQSGAYHQNLVAATLHIGF
ncbi:outer membrane beta-barrel protein [Acidisoma cladoniae]|jgi:hypothetical protein|uniref:outer membrane beta-barrel protein n=1 Tax=Acidisoma cladoniae TaxID=3040935 RepID=UPI00254C0894|nr:outer membrane beta-barrel protein [Acidisoma sp. PAMC 29798]